MSGVKAFIQKTHIGLWIFLAIKIAILCQIARGDQESLTGLLAVYAVSTLIALTPVGEFILCLFAKAWSSPRADMKDHIEFILEDIVNDAKAKTPAYSGKIRLKVIRTEEPYVCALGRKTIAFSPSFLELPDDEQRGLLASEVAHLALRHNIWMMLAGCSNPLFLFMWLFLQVTKWMFILVGVVFCLFTNSSVDRVVTAVTMALIHFSVMLWTGFCMLFIYFENRQNVYTADRYAADLGYGYELARGIDDLKYLHMPMGLLSVLFQSKPSPDARINSLIAYGVPYRGY